MTHDEFAVAMSDACQEAQLRLSKASRDKQYWSIPQHQLLALFQKYRNVNLTTPDSPFALTAMIFGFVGIAVVNRMSDIYTDALKTPAAWLEVVARCRRELNDMSAQVLNDMDAALGRS
jgi:hypothetical protein